jgi:hypothetical protein
MPIQPGFCYRRNEYYPGTCPIPTYRPLRGKSASARCLIGGIGPYEITESARNKHLSRNPRRNEVLSSRALIVEDNTQERTIDVKPAVILNETQFLEFVHEEVDPRTR